RERRRFDLDDFLLAAPVSPAPLFLLIEAERNHIGLPGSKRLLRFFFLFVLFLKFSYLLRSEVARREIFFFFFLTNRRSFGRLFERRGESLLSVFWLGRFFMNWFAWRAERGI